MGIVWLSKPLLAPDGRSHGHNRNLDTKRHGFRHTAIASTRRLLPTTSTSACWKGTTCYLCDLPKAFANTKDFKNHFGAVHLDRRDFRCTGCLSTFKTNSNCNKRIRTALNCQERGAIVENLRNTRSGFPRVCFPLTPSPSAFDISHLNSNIRHSLWSRHERTGEGISCAGMCPFCLVGNGRSCLWRMTPVS